MDNFTFGSSKACQYLAQELAKCDSGTRRKVTNHIKRADIILKKLVIQCGKDYQFFNYLILIIKDNFISRVANSSWPLKIKTLSLNVLSFKFRICINNNKSEIN